MACPGRSHSHRGPCRFPSAPGCLRGFYQEDFFSSPTMSMHSSTHWSQMNTVGPAISLRTSCWLLPQNGNGAVRRIAAAGLVHLSTPTRCELSRSLPCRLSHDMLLRRSFSALRRCRSSTSISVRPTQAIEIGFRFVHESMLQVFLRINILAFVFVVVSRPARSITLGVTVTSACFFDSGHSVGLSAHHEVGHRPLCLLESNIHRRKSW